MGQPVLPVQQAVLPVQQAVPTAVQRLLPTVPSVQQPLPLPVQTPTVQPPRLPVPVLPEAVAAVPGRPVLADDAVLVDTVQSISTEYFCTHACTCCTKPGLVIFYN